MTIYTPTVLAPIATRVRAEFNGKTIADSRNVFMFRESPFRINYYFPNDDVNTHLIDRDSAKSSSGKNGKRTSWSIHDGERVEKEGAFSYTEPNEDYAELRDRIAFDFEAIDRWFEEDEELIGHPRDPYTRIDVRRSSQHIQIKIDGIAVIDSKRPFILTETGLPLRYYIPSDDVKWNYFTESDTETICPYKGKAIYWNAVVNGNEYPDIMWGYPEPLQDAMRIKDTVGLYHEKLDVLVDGEKPKDWPVYFTK